METGGSPAVAVQKTALTPKAILYHKFGSKACYNIEEVPESAQNECPGLAISQKGPCLFRCSLQLPEICVVSGIFKRKKEAEQHAAELALEKLGINPITSNPTQQDPWDALVGRVQFLFSDEFLTSVHPLSGHLRAALQREGDLYGCVPVSVIAGLDAKVSSLSKVIDPKVELNPYLVASYVTKAAAQLSGIIITSAEQHWIRRQSPYPLEIIDSAFEESGSPGSFLLKAIYIPSSNEKTIEVVNLNVSSTGYYLDVVAKQLGLVEASEVLMSRPIGKASSEARLYFPASQSCVLELSSDIGTQHVHSEQFCNARASYLSGEDIYGDAIFASIGYTWKSKDLWHEDLSMKSYYRMLLGKIPAGVYKLSRGAILTADLPSAFTTRANWRGTFPRDILCAFCRQHRLSEPVLSTVSVSEELSEPSGLHKKLKGIDTAVEGAHCVNGCAADGVKEAAQSGGMYRCEVRIYSKSQDLIIECAPKESYKKQSDSIQNASLKVLLWLDAYFKVLDTPLERLEHSSHELNINFDPQRFFSAFSLCQSVRTFQHGDTKEGRSHDSNSMPGQRMFFPDIYGQDSGVSPSNGSLSCISYSVTLVIESEDVKELLESSDEFEFEIGSQSVSSQVEAAVTQMTVGQSALLYMDLPPQDFILAAADDSGRILSLLSSKHCRLQYTITLIRVTEPLEDRMEQALFSPPLSKQRVEYALQHIKQSCATNLVDFGCGSGSLLDSLLNYRTSLEKIVGVDISHKSLIRAAKILHSKLNTSSDTDAPLNGIKSAILYDGSITGFDSRLCGFDIGTCLEVIEHMEEDQAWLFGDVVLSYFCPKILIVSTPNYEYNVILQRSNLSSQEEDPDDKTQSQSSKFRNHDHKFEWTREQFNHWATDLAAKHNYSVEFSGVGGSGDEPGFASQIAVFRKETSLVNDPPKVADLEHQYNVVWEWDSSNRS